MFSKLNGFRNPNAAIVSLFWGGIQYSNIETRDISLNKMSRFDRYMLGRYAYAYIISPMLAAPLAAFLARKHL